MACAAKPPMPLLPKNAKRISLVQVGSGVGLPRHQRGASLIRKGRTMDSNNDFHENGGNAGAEGCAPDRTRRPVGTYWRDDGSFDVLFFAASKAWPVVAALVYVCADYVLYGLKDASTPGDPRVWCVVCFLFVLFATLGISSAATCWWAFKVAKREGLGVNPLSLSVSPAGLIYRRAVSVQMFLSLASTSTVSVLMNGADLSTLEGVAGVCLAGALGTCAAAFGASGCARICGTHWAREAATLARRAL